MKRVLKIVSIVAGLGFTAWSLYWGIPVISAPGNQNAAGAVIGILVGIGLMPLCFWVVFPLINERRIDI
jgi:hypothetical protein